MVELRRRGRGCGLRGLALAGLAWAAACGGIRGDSAATERGVSVSAPVAEGQRADRGAQQSAASAVTRCPGESVPVFEEGRQVREICRSDAAAGGLTLVDLSDDFTPFVFSEDPALGEVGAQPYRAIFLALADERPEDVPEDFVAEHHLELFGIFPTFRVLRARLVDEARHECHARVDGEAVAHLDRTMRAWGRDRDEQRARLGEARLLGRRLERLASAAGLGSVDALATDPRHGALYERWRSLRVPVLAVEALQDHLICDGLLAGRFERGVFDDRTARATDEWHRRHMVLSGPLFTSGTRALVATGSFELDYRAALRALRERVVAATGLIEDGSAGRAWGTILDRVVDPPEIMADAGQPAASDPAPDLVSPATEAAARALGWTEPAGVVRFFAELPGEVTSDLVVALRLPPLPAYHGPQMELRAEIDRGDVWYQYPYTDEGEARRQPVARRPVVTVFAKDGERWVAVVRWATTIGGWKPETLPEGGVGLRYKESPVGPRVWRDVIASPAWLPPPSTPADELVRRTPRGLRPNHDLFGPGFRSAYGLAMLMHHKVIPPWREGRETVFWDEGVRTHGSVSYRSILRGTSHGCHRVYNHLAVRLASFVLAHRPHVRHGDIRVSYQRTVELAGQSATFRIASRGYRFELTPPVPVEVLDGRLRGFPRVPIEGFRSLPEDLVAAVQQDAAEDG